MELKTIIRYTSMAKEVEVLEERIKERLLHVAESLGYNWHRLCDDLQINEKLGIIKFGVYRKYDDCPETHNLTIKITDFIREDFKEFFKAEKEREIREEKEKQEVEKQRKLKAQEEAEKAYFEKLKNKYEPQQST